MGLVERVPLPAVQWIRRQQFRPVIGPVVRAFGSRLRNRPRVVAHGQAAGLRIDPAGANPGYALGTSEALVQDVFAAHVPSGGVVWDIGANIGFYSLIASRLVEDGRVVAFEPLSSNLEAIRRNLQLNGINNVELVEIALGETNGTAGLEIHTNQTWAKLDTSADTRYHTNRKAIRQIQVPVSTIDLQMESVPAPDLVKMDIEGAEVAALRGASKLLARRRPTIICELHGTNQAVCDLLESHGYAVTVIETPEVQPRAANWNVHVLAVPPERTAE
jgi:FkbM family methyltransferase